jgi:hypothetical protein
VGNNSAAGGPAEVQLWAGTAFSDGQATWCGPGAFDSGWVPVRLTVESGSVTWEAWPAGAAGAVTVTAAGPAFQTVKSVELRASATGSGRRAAWGNTSVVFYRSGGGTDPYVVPDECDPDADNAGGSGTATKVEQVPPDYGDVVKVVVSGQVKLSSTGTTLPGQDDVFADANVFVV